MKGRFCLAAVGFALFFSFSLSLAQVAPVAQIGVFRPGTGQWFLDFSGNRAWDRCGPDGCLVQFGAPGDRPVAGDWNGDGAPEIGVYRPSTGQWFLDRNGNGFWDDCVQDRCLTQFGASIDLPVVGDWTGTGTVRIGVFRPATGQWFLDLNDNGLWDGCGTDRCLEQFGSPTDLPVAGDIDADGLPEVGVYRPFTGQWFFDRNNNGLWDGCGTEMCLTQFGATGDQPVLADMNGDGTLEVGVFRPDTGQWFFDLDHSGSWSGCGADGCFGPFGAAVDLPVTGAWDPLAGPGDPQNYFPFSQGSTWTYQGTSVEDGIFTGSYQNTVTVSGTRVIDGVTTTVFTQSNPENVNYPIDQYFLKDGRGITNWGNNDAADTITPKLVAYQEAIFPLRTGASFLQYQRSGLDLGEDLDDDFFPERVDITSRITVAGFETVSVPAGTFPGSARIVNTLDLFVTLTSFPSIRVTGTITTTSWFAPGVGPVKREVRTQFFIDGETSSSITTESLTTFSIAVPPPPPQILGNPLQIGTGEAPRVAVAANGDAVSVWVNQNSIWANRYTAGAGWETPAQTEDHMGLANPPVIAVDPDGNATVAWVELNDPFSYTYNLWTNRFTAETGWSVPEIVDANPGPNSFPNIAADPNGNVTLIWRKNEGGTQSIWANRYEPGTGWGVPVRIEPAGGWAESPRLAVDAAGNAIAVWYEQVLGLNYNVWANRYVPGVGWGQPELIEGNAGIPTVNELALAINPAGTAIVVWSQGDGLYQSVWANRYFPGSGWGSAVPVETNPFDTFSTQVAVASDGSAIAVWLQSDGTYQRIWANRFVPGSGWGVPSPIEDNPGNSGADAQIAIGPTGNAAAVWTQVDGDQWSLWAGIYTPGTGWSTPQRLEADTGTAYGPQLAVDSGGNFLAVWYQWNGNGWSVWANRF